MSRRRGALAPAAALAVACLTALAGPARADVRVVTSPADDGAGSLRAQVLAAQDGDEIVFDTALTGQTIALESAIAIERDISIEGLGASGGVVLTTAANNADYPTTLFDVGEDAIAALRDLEVRDAHGADAADSTGAGDAGGNVITNRGALAIQRSTIADSTGGDGGSAAAGGGGGGGAVVANVGVLTIEQSTIAGNASGAGGNASDNNGGGAGGAVIANTGANLSLISSTLSGNVGGAGGESFGGGGGGAGGSALASTRGQVTVVNSTVAGNMAGRGGDGEAASDDDVPVGAGGGGFGGGGGAGTAEDEAAEEMGGFGGANGLDGTAAASDGGIFGGGGGSGFDSGPQGGLGTGGNGGGGAPAGSGGGWHADGPGEGDVQGGAAGGGNGGGGGGGGGAGPGAEGGGNGGVGGGGGSGFRPGEGFGGASDGAYVDETQESYAGAGTGAGALVIYGGGLDVRNSTLAQNRASDGGNAVLSAQQGGGALVRPDDVPEPPQVTLVSSMLAGTPAGAADCRGEVTGDNTVIIQNLGLGFCEAPGVRADVNPDLGPLTDNGGPTETMALGENSEAIDNGSNPLDLESDQRGDGFPRTVGEGTDIGAYERSTAPELAVTDLDFGTVEIPNVKDGSVTVTNTGEQSTGPLTSAVSGAGFSIPPGGDGCVGVILVGAASCDITVRLTAASPAGQRTGEIAVSGEPGGTASGALSGVVAEAPPTPQPAPQPPAPDGGPLVPVTPSGGTPPPAPAPQPPPRTVRAAQAIVTRTVVPLKGRHIDLPVECETENVGLCVGPLIVSATPAALRAGRTKANASVMRRIARGRYRIRRNGRRVVRLRLSPAAIRVLRRTGRLPATAQTRTRVPGRRRPHVRNKRIEIRAVVTRRPSFTG